MTLATSTNRWGSYVCNGITTEFTYSGLVKDYDTLYVYKTNTSTNVVTTLTKDTDYTVTGLDDPAGGIVTISPAIPTGYSITIVRTVPLTQTTDLANGGAFFAETHEDVFDKLMMAIQQVQEEANRSVKVGITSDTDPDDLIEQILIAASKVGIVVFSHIETGSAAQTIIDLSGESWVLPLSQEATFIFIDGVKMASDVWTRTDDNTITLTTPLIGGEKIEVVSGNSSVANLATRSEAEAGINNVNLVTPLRVSQALDALRATQSEAEAGTDNTKMMTPLRVSQAIAELAEAKAIITDTTIYVATTGSDTTGDGTSGSPFATLHKAFSYLDDYYISAIVTIDVADGTYTFASELEIKHPCASRIIVDGNTGTPTNVLLQATAMNGLVLNNTNLKSLQGFRILGDGTNTGIGVYNDSFVGIEDVVVDNFDIGLHLVFGRSDIHNSTFKNCTDSGVYVAHNSLLTGENPTITGNNYGLYATGRGSVRFKTPVVTSNNYGLYANGNSQMYIYDTSSISTNTTADFSPAVSTGTTPTWGNYCSFINKVNP